ncbi:MAG: SURF1 family protein [Xanthomonadales bacterium]|nr:SURF1 family protein [Xanthomonadales bacterium]
MRELLRRHTPALSWLLLALCLVVFINAGRWQHDKAMAKHERIAAFEDARQQPATAFDGIAIDAITGDAGNSADAGFKRIHVNGRILPQRYLLDNQVRGGRPGIEVFAPMHTDTGAHLLLALGWLAYPDARRQLPALPNFPALAENVEDDAASGIAGETGDGASPDRSEAAPPMQFSGLLAPPPAYGLRLGRNWPEQPGPDKLMPYFDIAEVATDSGLPLIERVLWLDAEPASPWLRDWQPTQGMPPERHLAYAWQWWSMAVASVIVFIVLHYRRRNRK